MYFRIIAKYSSFTRPLSLWPESGCHTSHRNYYLTILLLNTTCPALANSVDPDQLASEEANWSRYALFVIKYVNFYQKPRSSNLIGWKLEVGVAFKFIQHDKG